MFEIEQSKQSIFYKPKMEVCMTNKKEEITKGVETFDVKKTIKKINNLLKKTVFTVIDIGKELSIAKASLNEKDYKDMYSTLSFTEATGRKFINIFKDENIKKYAQYCPVSYSTLGEYLKDKDDATWKYLIGKGMNCGSTKISVKNWLKDYQIEILKLSGEEEVDVAEDDGVEDIDTANGNISPSDMIKSVIELKFSSNDAVDVYKEMNAIDEVIAEIKSYAEEKFAENKILADKVTVISKEMTANELGIELEDGTNEELDEVA